MRLRLMTYNIHKGIGGVDRRYDLGRVVDVIAHYAPDIVLLQEVDDGVPRSQHHCQVEAMSVQLDLPHQLFQANVAVKNGHYGNAILSRFPLGEQTDLDLRVSIKKPRRALITHTEFPIRSASFRLTLCNTHLGLSGFERSVQIKRILKHEQVSAPEDACIVGGDFNDVWVEHGRKLMFPFGFHCAVDRAKTFPAALPVRSLDAMYYRGHLRLLDSFAGRFKLARQASDHLPIIADFEITQ